MSNSARMQPLWILVLLLGCATTPTPQPSAEEFAAREAEALAAHRTAWLQAHSDLLAELRAEADILADARERIFDTTESWRTDPKLLNDALVDCPLLLDEVTGFAETVAGHVAESRIEELPTLPEGWITDASIREQRRTLNDRCAGVPALIDRWNQAEAAKAEAEEARADLARNRRTRNATEALSAADQTLRDVVGHETFVMYLDGMDAWQVAATHALRESVKPEPDPVRLAELRTLEAAAQQHVRALNAGMTLKISGRSDQVNEAIKAAAKALKKLKEDDRQAVMAAFPPEVTPASSVLLQLVTDRL